MVFIIYFVNGRSSSASAAFVDGILRKWWAMTIDHMLQLSAVNTNLNGQQIISRPVSISMDEAETLALSSKIHKVS